MEIYSHNFMRVDIIQYVLAVYHVLLYFVCHVCFAMYNITDVVFSISNKE